MKTLQPSLARHRRSIRWRTRRTKLSSCLPEHAALSESSNPSPSSHPSQPIMKVCALPQPEQNTAREDAALMHAIAARDPDALGALYDRYSGILKALVIRVVHDEAEADDLLQEIFMQIWRQAKNYSQKKGQALGWIVTLTRRRAIDRLRKRQAYHRVTERLEL